ncbi:MAG: hypothetical protein Q7T13_20555 [Polaromonas sp.]|nr:hypothetical protein [Polaromonas sp.]
MNKLLAALMTTLIAGAAFAQAAAPAVPAVPATPAVVKAEAKAEKSVAAAVKSEA